MTRLSSVLIVAFGFLSTLPSEAVADAFPWRHDLDAARAEAHQTGRLILAHFWAPWCGPCKRLDQTVFTKPEVAAAISANYVPVKLDADQNRALAERLGIKGVPNDVILTADGQVVAQFVSPATPEGYMSRMAQVAASISKPTGNMQVDAATTRSTADARRVNGTQAINSAYANLAVSTDGPAQVQSPAVVAVPVAQTAPHRAAAKYGPDITTNQPVAVQPPFNSPGTAAVANRTNRSERPVVQSTSPPSFGANRYAIPQEAPAVVANRNSTPASNLGRYAIVEQAGNASLTPEVGRTTPQQTAMPDPRAGFVFPAISSPPIAQQPIDISRRPPGQNLAAQNLAAQNLTAQNAAGQTTGAPRLGLDGYCPVSLQNTSLAPNDPRRWVRGNASWGAVHRGKTYLFAGQAERDQFLQTPDLYAPVFSGMDPVLALGAGQMVLGKREMGVWYGGKIYLFSSEQSIEQFSKDPDFYAERIRQAMGVGKPTTLR